MTSDNPWLQSNEHKKIVIGGRLRIKIKFRAIAKPGLKLPQHHNYLIQAFIYHNLNKQLSAQLHNYGYRYEKRQFRLFTFSRIYGRFLRKEKELIYPGECLLWIASPITEILESFASHLARKSKFKLGRQFCQVLSIEVPFTQEYTDEINVRVLSPITVYSTLITSDKKKKTYYYTPFENEFSELIKKNLIKKLNILNNQETEYDCDFTIEPLKVSKQNEHIVYYKKTVVKAWSGIYRLMGTPSLIKVAFDCGLGAKNSQGFGMIERYG